ncbi:unnamed protein product [Bursaphelenchus xylophilus]|uniref:(pine wood nematode) hypothetical protein n=1 Tax=Bursaphelenchus xylophilus TaxID=6326 RepID=A0A7I8X5S7_BURXY|nr:unnamed protein product [Bursaphelenchus xylophilus]CAG9122783.1 unnamed protein product [Bursaphelenchus xylophilus]
MTPSDGQLIRPDGCPAGLMRCPFRGVSSARVPPFLLPKTANSFSSVVGWKRKEQCGERVHAEKLKYTCKFKQNGEQWKEKKTNKYLVNTLLRTDESRGRRDNTAYEEGEEIKLMAISPFFH